MTAIRHPILLLRRAFWPALGLLIVANFIGYALIGDNGVLSWGEYRRAKAEQAHQLARLELEKARLAHRVALLDPRHVDPDLAEELVRAQLGVFRPDEVIIPIPPEIQRAAAAR